MKTFEPAMVWLASTTSDPVGLINHPDGTQTMVIHDNKITGLNEEAQIERTCRLELMAAAPELFEAVNRFFWASLFNNQEEKTRAFNCADTILRKLRELGITDERYTHAPNFGKPK